MENWIDTFTGFLVVSSALLLALGALSCLILYAFKINGKARLLVCSMLLIMPVAYPIGSLIPDHHKVPLPSEKLQTILPAALEPGINTFTHDRGRSAGSAVFPVAIDKSADIQSSSTQPSVPDLYGDTSFALTWKQAVTGAWIFLFVFILVRSFFIFRKIRRLVKCADGVTDPTILAVLQRCQKETGLRRSPRLLVVDHTLTPLAVGFLRPAVILPARLLMPEFREGLRFTLLHELKHLQRLHNWWLLFESLVGAVYFFHPVIYWAKRKIHEEWEHICDRHVVKVTNKPASYADFLLHEIWNQGRQTNPSLAMPLIFTARKTTKRVHSILEIMRPTLFTKIRDRIAISTVFMCFISLFLCTVTPSANVNKDEVKPAQIEWSQFTVNETVPSVKENTENLETVSIDNDSVSEGRELQESKHEERSLTEKENNPKVLPTNTEKPSIDTQSRPSVLTEKTGIPEDEELLPGNETLFETSDLLASIDPESLLAPSQIPQDVSVSADEKKDEPDRDTAREAENHQQDRSATDMKGEPSSENVSIPMGARIFDWKVIDDSNLIIMTRFYGSFKATLAKDCPELSKYRNRKNLRFDSNWPYELDVNSSIILPNDDVYEIQKLVPYKTKNMDYINIF